MAPSGRRLREPGTTHHVPSIPSPLNPETPARRRCSSTTPPSYSSSPASTPHSRRPNTANSSNTDLSPTQRLLRQKAAVAWRAAALRSAMDRDGTALPGPQASSGSSSVVLPSSPLPPTTAPSDTSQGNNDDEEETQRSMGMGSQQDKKERMSDNEGSSREPGCRWSYGLQYPHHNYDLVFENEVPCVSTGWKEENMKKLCPEETSPWYRLFFSATFDGVTPSADMEKEEEEKDMEERKWGSSLLSTHASSPVSQPPSGWKFQMGKEADGASEGDWDERAQKRPGSGMGGEQRERHRDGGGGRLVTQRSLVITSVLCVLGIWSVVQALRRLSSSDVI